MLFTPLLVNMCVTINTTITIAVSIIFIKSEDNGTTWDKVSEITDFTTRPTNEVGIEYVGNDKEPKKAQ